MSLETQYNFPVWATPCGGLVRWEDGKYYFIEIPSERHGDGEHTVGSLVPHHCNVKPMNEAARHCQEEADEFARGLEEFFDMAFDHVEAGEMSLEQVGEFIPNEVKHRALKPVPAADCKQWPVLVKRVRRAHQAADN